MPVEDKPESYLPLERLWAYLTIQQLLDERQVSDLKDDDENSPAKKALKLALKVYYIYFFFPAIRYVYGLPRYDTLIAQLLIKLPGFR